MPSGIMSTYRCSFALLLTCLLLAPVSVLAQPEAPLTAAPTASKVLGASFTLVPELLYAQVPALPRGQGLVIATVPKNTTAERIGLHRNDILLKVQTTPIQSTKDLAQVLMKTPPGSTSELVILRNGKPVTLQCSLQVGDLPSAPKTEVKSGGPPKINLEAKPLDNGKVLVTLTFYGNGSKQQMLTCTGTPGQIEAEVRQMTIQQELPAGVRDLVEVALERFRIRAGNRNQ